MKKAVDNKKTIKNGNEQKTKKNNTFFAVLFTVLLFVAIVVVGLFVIYFNIGNAGYEVMKALQKNDSVYISQQAAVNETKTFIEKKEAELLKAEETLTTKEKDLAKKEKVVVEREKQIELDQKEIDELRTSLNGQLNSIQDMVDIYKSMDAKTAASLLEKQKNDEMTLKVLEAMDNKLVASILSNMDPDYAASLLAKMTN